MRQPYDKKTQPIQIRVTKPCLEKLRELAARDRRTVSGLVRIFIENAISDLESVGTGQGHGYQNDSNGK